MWKSLFFGKTDTSDLALRQQLNAAHRSNHQLAKALEELVQIHEQWNEAVARVVGKPPGWGDEYLRRARHALAAHAEYAQCYRSKKRRGDHY